MPKPFGQKENVKIQSEWLAQVLFKKRFAPFSLFPLQTPGMSIFHLKPI